MCFKNKTTLCLWYASSAFSTPTLNTLRLTNPVLEASALSLLLPQHLPLAEHLTTVGCFVWFTPPLAFTLYWAPGSFTNVFLAHSADIKLILNEQLLSVELNNDKGVKYLFPGVLGVIWDTF